MELLLLPFYGPLSGTIWVSRYQKKHSPTYTYPDHQSSFICFLHLCCHPWHTPCSIYMPDSFFCKISVQVFFGLPLGLAPSTSYSTHFFTQSLSSFRKTCPYHCNLFCCRTETISSNPRLSLSSLLGTLSFSLTPHIHLTILISVRWSATSFSFLAGQVSLPCNILLCTQPLYNLPLAINDTSLLVSSGTKCLNSGLHSCINNSMYTQHVT